MSGLERLRTASSQTLLLDLVQARSRLALLAGFHSSICVCGLLDIVPSLCDLPWLNYKLAKNIWQVWASCKIQPTAPNRGGVGHQRQVCRSKLPQGWKPFTQNTPHSPTLNTHLIHLPGSVKELLQWPQLTHCGLFLLLCFSLFYSEWLSSAIMSCRISTKNRSPVSS